MQIDYTRVDSRIENLIRGIEGKPHVRYIRYLLSKKYSPAYIKQELRKAGLSAPHEEQLVKYYLAVMDPVIKQLKLTKVYAEFKKKLTMKNSKRAPGAFMNDLLNYRLTFGEELDLQPNFSKFVKYMEIDDIWKKEILRYHGTVDRLPVDDAGARILTFDQKDLNYEKVLMCPKRHLIDKLLLEHIPDTRIVDYLQKSCNIRNISPADVRAYRKIFFNIRVITTEEIIHTLECERDSLKQFLSDFESSSTGDEMSLSERMVTIQTTNERIDELDDSVRELMATHSDAVADVAFMEEATIRAMFVDIMKRGHSRFVRLDRDLSRDAVDPLLKTVTMMTKAYEKVQSIEESEAWQKSGDKNSQEMLLGLYKERIEDSARDYLEKANARLKGQGDEEGLNPDLDFNEIVGIEELGVNYIEADGEKK